MDAYPAANNDGTLTAIVDDEMLKVGLSRLLRLRVPPAADAQNGAGRYLLVRCGVNSEADRADQWGIYLRRALFITGRRTVHDHSTGEPLHDELTVTLPPDEDPGGRWLAARSEGDPLNLIGPLGRGFRLADQARHLLLVATPDRWPKLRPLIDPMLDRGGRVTLVITEAHPDAQIGRYLRPQLPLPVELHLFQEALAAGDEIAAALRWADQVAVALPISNLGLLSQLIRAHRFRLEPSFAQALVEADYVCGVGSCLACVVATEQGKLTRACIHGPAMDLSHLAR